MTTSLGDNLNMPDGQLPTSTEAKQPGLSETGQARDGTPLGEGGVARLLTRFRQERGISRSDLAERTGMNPSTITRLEQGTRAPERNTILQLAKAMVLPIADRDRLLAEGGYRSEMWDDPLLIELAQLLASPEISDESQREAQSVVRMAIAYLKLSRLHNS